MMRRRMRGMLERRRDRREKAAGQDDAELHDEVRKESTIGRKIKIMTFEDTGQANMYRL